MAIELNLVFSMGATTPRIPVRYVFFEAEVAAEGRYGLKFENELIDFSGGNSIGFGPGRDTRSERSADFELEIFEICTESLKISVEQKLGDLFDFLIGQREGTTPQQILAELSTINITLHGARDGQFRNVEASAAIAPFSAFVRNASFLTLNVEWRFEASETPFWGDLEGRGKFSMEAFFTAAITIAATRRGALPITRIFYRTAVRAVTTTARIGSWISRTFSAAGLTGEAALVGGTVIGGAIIGSAAATAFAMWLIDVSHRAGVARGLTNQIASGFVRYIFDRPNIFANLTQRTGSLYFARVRGGNMAHRDVQASSEMEIKETYKHLLFPEQTRGLTDQYIRSNMGVAIDRMTRILEASGLGYTPDEITG